MFSGWFCFLCVSLTLSPPRSTCGEELRLAFILEACLGDNCQSARIFKAPLLFKNCLLKAYGVLPLSQEVFHTDSILFLTVKRLHLPISQVMSQAEGQQKNLVRSIDSLPTRGPLSCLDQDLLLLKATSAATLSCLGECLNILQQTQSQCQPPAHQFSERSHTAQRAPSGESPPLGAVPVPPLEPTSSPSSPPPPTLLSFQPPPPEVGGSHKVQQLDCDSCSCLMATVNFGVCSKCCWMLPRVVAALPSTFASWMWNATVTSCVWRCQICAWMNVKC